ncbi:class I adenylate-forming enzyme family protein [Rhodococcoides corynebacterioides]|uniref:class I adenylate-forming enzyme family protein n=1 Tax=Rhodococcoides corynebacterioides TaxID=53972 RepID=UPI003F7D1519
MLASTDMPSLVLQSLVDRVQRSPDRPCVSDSTRALTNADVGAEVARLADRLTTAGVRPGDVIAALLPNRVEVVTTMYAAWFAGAALTPINPALTDDEVVYQLRDSAAVVIVGDERAVAVAAQLGITAIDVTIDDGPGWRTRDEPAVGHPDVVRSPEDVALVVYTSGTTGRPKGCVLTHRNIDRMSAAVIAICGLTENDRSLLVLPLFHCNGLVVGTVAPLRAGGDVHIAPRFSPETFWQNVSEVRPTYFSAVPTMYSLLADLGPTQHDLRSLRFAVCGAAPMPTALIATCETLFGIPIAEGYGLSECTVAATMNPPFGQRKPGTVGCALPGVDVAIDGPDGITTTPGTSGEVVVRGGTVMRGYLGLTDVTATTIRDGWLHTGDIGFLDDDGYLTLVDRLKDMIIRGGENIAPSEVENVLQTNPDVLEVAVVGHPDPVYGEIPVAHVVARSGRAIATEDLADLCERTLARYKRPVAYVVHDALPKSAIGKILKRSLSQSTPSNSLTTDCGSHRHAR